MLTSWQGANPLQPDHCGLRPPSLAPDERRFRQRYAMELRISYVLLRRKSVIARGGGETINLSSSGILCRSSSALVDGGEIRMRIPWPVIRDGKPLVLVAEGKILRCEPPYFALGILRYRFRTSSGSPNGTRR
jgi:hypothetical protein